VRGDRTALLVVDMLNTYEHDDADKLAASVQEAMPRIADLIGRARAADVALAALEMMERNMHAEISAAAELRL
jgi:nicotinamidase-related amidase